MWIITQKAFHKLYRGKIRGIKYHSTEIHYEKWTLKFTWWLLLLKIYSTHTFMFTMQPLHAL